MLRRSFSVLAACASLGAAAAPAASAQAAADDVLKVNFDYLTGPVGQPVTVVKVQGSASVAPGIAQRNGGQVLVAAPRPGQGDAVSFPPFDASASSPRAVIRIASAAAPDQLNPGVRNFSYGADFVLDSVSSAHGSNDDGDNLVQRGLYDDPDQYKLQLDGRAPMCRVKGAVGRDVVAVEVTSPVKVDSSHWYRVECTRTARQLEVMVRRFNDDGTTTVTTTSVSSAAVIDVTMDVATVPFSIGGKLNPDGTVAVNTDQFNGRVDNVFLRYS